MHAEQADKPPPPDLTEILDDLLGLWGVKDKLARLVGAGYGFIVSDPVKEALQAQGLVLPADQQLSPSFVLSGGVPERLAGCLVFLVDGEDSLTKRLRRSYPGQTILSFCDDVLTQAPPTQASAEKADQAASQKLLLLSLPGSEAEYFSWVLEAAGYARPIEYLVPAHGAAACVRDHWNPLVTVSRKAGLTAQTRGYSVHCQADTLMGLEAAGHNVDRLVRRIARDASLKCIYFARRDKMAQAVLLDRLAPQGLRSVWSDIWDTDTGATAQLSSLLEGLQPQDPLQSLSALIGQEIRLEALLPVFKDRIKMFYLEDLLSDPAAVVKAVTNFLGEPKQPTNTVPPYSDTHLLLPWLRPAATKFRSELIGLTGLSRNIYGSFETPGSRMLEAIAEQV